MSLRDEDPSENLPSVPEAPPLLESVKLSLKGPVDLDALTTVQEAKEADVQVANDLIKASYVALTNSRSVSTLCRAIEQTVKVIEARRKILLLPYGAEVSRSRASFLHPID